MAWKLNLNKLPRTLPLRGANSIRELHCQKGIGRGAEFENRLEGLKLFKRLDTEDALILSKLDRAFRNTRNTLNTLHELKLHGIPIHFIDLVGEVTNNAIGPVIFTILSAFASFEGENSYLYS